jgi:hypothetical protein
VSDSHLARLWAICGGLALYLSVNSWLVSQGGWPILDIGLVHPGRWSASVLALWFVPLLLCLISIIGLCYAHPRRRGLRRLRWPVLCAPDFDPERPSATVWQGLVLGALVLFPAGACIHFWVRMHRMLIVRTSDPAAAPLTIWTKIKSAQAGSRDFRIADYEVLANGTRKLIGTSYVPWFETWILIGFHGLTAALLLWYLAVLLRPGR